MPCRRSAEILDVPSLQLGLRGSQEDMSSEMPILQGSTYPLHMALEEMSQQDRHTQRDTVQALHSAHCMRTQQGTVQGEQIPPGMCSLLGMVPEQPSHCEDSCFQEGMDRTLLYLSLHLLLDTFRQGRRSSPWRWPGKSVQVRTHEAPALQCLWSCTNTPQGMAGMPVCLWHLGRHCTSHVGKGEHARRLGRRTRPGTILGLGPPLHRRSLVDMVHNHSQMRLPYQRALFHLGSGPEAGCHLGRSAPAGTVTLAAVRPLQGMVCCCQSSTHTQRYRHH